LKHVKTQNCGNGSQVITFVNGSMKLTGDCRVSVTGCTILKPYTKFEATFIGIDLRSSMVLNVMKFDVCDKKIKSEVLKANLFGFNIPIKCPIKKETLRCVKESIYEVKKSLQKVIPILARNRELKLTMNSKHDHGTSCLTSTFSFKSTKN
jgi:hypothetical protein